MNASLDPAKPLTALDSGMYGPAWRSLLKNIDWPLKFFMSAWFLVVIVPLGGVIVYSFFETKSFFTVYTFSFNTWASIFESGRFEVILRTLRIAATVTVIELVLAFVFALWLAKGTPSKGIKAITLALLTIPFFLDISSRTIIWRALLGDTGWVTGLLKAMGVLAQNSPGILYTEWAVHFGIIISLFPTMMLPLYMAITLIDDALIDASNDLGGSPLQTLTRIIIPLALPGIITGSLFTFGSAMAAWVEPSMLGGGFVNLLGNSIESAYSALRYPVLAALTTLIIVILLGLVALLMLAMRLFGNRSSTSFSPKS